MTDAGYVLFKTIANCTINFFFCFTVIYLITRLPGLKNPRLRYSLLFIPLIKLWYDFFSGLYTQYGTGALEINGHALDLFVSVGFGSSGLSLWSLIFSCLIGQHACSMGDMALFYAGRGSALMLISLWAVTSFLLLARRLYGYISFLARVRSHGSSNARLDRIIMEAVGSTAPVPDGVLSDLIASPIAAGLVNPFIALPASLLDRLTDEELLLIVRHEMSHIRRYDNALNIIVALTGDMFFFLLPLRMLEKEIFIERERLSDRYVLENQERRAIPYAKALVKVAEFCVLQRNPSVVSGLSASSSDKKAIFKRMKEILSPDILSRSIFDRWYVHGPVALILLKLLIGASFFASSGSLHATTCAAMRIIVSA
jgi:beta-lactamase regulating signal transducer with metallopeptidase domain